MNRDEFLKTIERESAFMPPKRRRAVIAHFRTLFSGGASEEAVADGLGNPSEALRAYLSDTAKPSKHPIPKPLIYIGALLLSPILLGIGMGLATAAFALIIAVLLLLFSVTAASAVMWIGGIGIAVVSIFQPAVFADKLWQIGAGLIISGLGIVFLLLLFKLYRIIIPAILGAAARLHCKIEGRKRR